MSNVKYNIWASEDSSNVTVIVDGVMKVADDKHPAFNEILAEVVKPDADAEVLLNLFDASIALNEKFKELSERVRVSSSRVYVDQTEVEDAYADQIIRFMESGEDFRPLVAFLEKVYSNTSEGIRENLSRWLAAEDFSILPNGNILGYRGLRSDYTSKHAGPGIVNGERVNGHLDNSVGNVVEIDADLVEDNPRVGCASGLHVGTHNYASGWAGYDGVLVRVEVDPRHVRSVPYECDSHKMRVSKYRVLDAVKDKINSAVADQYDGSDEFEDNDEDYGTYAY